MTEEEFKKMSSKDGVCLAYKEGDCIYPIMLSQKHGKLLSLLLREAEIQVLKTDINKYKKV